MAEEPDKKEDKPAEGEAPKDEVIDAAALEQGKEKAENKLTGDESTEEQLKSGGDDGLETRHISPVTELADSSTSDAPTGKKAPEKRTFIQKTIGRINIWLLLFFLVVIIAIGTVVVMYALNKKEQNITITTEKLTQDTLNQLKAADSTIGDPKSTLSVESNAVFAGKVLVRSDVDIAGGLKLGGALSIPSLSVTSAGQFGQLSTNQLTVSGALKVGGAADIQKNVTIGGDLSVNGNIDARAINIDNISITHINVTGPTPGVTVGGGAGSGGTVSIVGNDTAGTVTINTGGLPPAGILATIKFTKAFSSATPHAVITPNGPGCAAADYYVTNTNATQFAIGSSSTPAGATCKFNYVVIN